MTIQERLTKAQESIQELSNKLNALAQERQDTLQEMLRLDGAIRELNSIIKEDKKK